MDWFLYDIDLRHESVKSKYRVEIKDVAIKKLCPKKILNIKKQGRPVLLKELDAKIQKCLIVARNRGAVITANIAIAAATGILKHSQDESMNHISFRRKYLSLHGVC